MGASAIIERIRTLLETTPPFSELSREDRQDILADISIEYYKPGEVIIEQGSGNHRGLYMVESGLVRLMDVEQQRLVDKCQEGDFFGSFGLLKGGGSVYEAKAIEEAVCALIRVGRFQHLYNTNESFALHFERDIRRYMRYIDSTRDVSGRHLLLTRKLGELVYQEIVSCAPNATAEQAAKQMSDSSVGSILVTKNGALEGIVTDGDLRDRILARGRDGSTPVRQVMSRSVQSIDSGRTLFDATMQMLQHGVHRLVVVSGDSGTPVGVLTDRDIAHFRGLDPLATLQRIDLAPSVERLADIRSGSHGLLLRLYRQGVSPEQVNEIAAIYHDRLAIRVLELTASSMGSRATRLLKRVPWAWLRLGSGGRREAALNSEQHNAIVYANISDAEEVRAAAEVFDEFAETVNGALEQCGFALSDVVAREKEWRKPLREWKKAYRTWIHKADEHALKQAPYFFDLRGIYGELSLVEELKQDMIDAINVQEMDGERKLLRLLTQNALEHRPPLSFLGRFVLERSGEHRNMFDMREHGVLPIASAARVLALELRYLESANTFDRLAAASERIPAMKETLEQAYDAYQCFTDFRLEHQLRQVENGEEPSNFIEPSLLSKLQQNMLRSASAAAAHLQDEIASRYNIKRGWTFPGF